MLGHCWVDNPLVHTSEWDSLFFKAICSPPSQSRRVPRTVSIGALHFNDSEQTIVRTILRIRTMGCMRIRQSPYEIAGDCSDKGDHRHQPLDHFVLWGVLARRRVMLILCVSTLFFLNCFGIELMLCDLNLTRFVLTKGFLFDTFFIVFFTNCVVVITEYLNSNLFHINELVNQTRHYNQMDHRQCFFMQMIHLRQDCAWKECAAGKTYTKMRRRQEFFGWMLLSTLSCWCNM